MKKVPVIVLLIVITLMLGVITNQIFKQIHSPRAPIAKNGVLDARDYDFQKGAIELKGEWEFVPGQLVEPKQYDSALSHSVKVPSLWTKYEIDGANVPKYTNGTYRLKILIDENDDVFGIKTTNIRMSNAIFIDGKLKGQSGQPGDEDTYVQHNIPYSIYFSPDQTEIELIVQVANFDYASGGGIVGSIYFGDQQSISKLHESSLLYDWVTISAFIMMFIYFFGSYLHFKKDIELFYFSQLCLAVIGYSASHGEKVLLSIIPNMTYEVFERIQMVTSICFGIFLLLYFYYALRKYGNRRILRLLVATGIFLNATCVLPIRLHSELQMAYSTYLLIIILYVIFIQIRAIKHKETGAVYLTVSSVAILGYFIVGTLNVISNFQLTILPPFLPFIILTMLSLFISYRFTDSFLKKEELSNALMRIDKLKDEFLAKTSHEFRTPLHGITAISQSIIDRKDSGMNEAEKEKVSLILSIAERLSHLVKDILDYSKLQQGELKLLKTPVDLYALTHVTVEIFQYMIKKDLRLTSHIPRGTFVFADEDRLRQILYNLIDNAVKYTEAGSVDISCYKQMDKVVLEVRDTGAGIPPEHMERLFEPFMQFENSVKGAGLGLSVVKQLVEVQGGEISVHSKVGEGTTFLVSVPAAFPNEMRKKKVPRQYFSIQSPVALSLPYRYENGPKKILIADDDHVNLRVLIDTLESEAYSIIAVDNGAAVLEELKNNPEIALVVLDIMMPGLSGYEVSQQIRKSFNLSELPILMLTAAITPEDMIAAFQSGANDFLHKPFVASELKTRIRNLLLMKESSETVTKMEIAFLQAQIKPHFIYNVLNTILSLSYIDLEKSRTMITDFATFLRGSFAFENTSRLVPLEKELSLIQSYVNIHRTRFPDQLELEIEMDGDFHCLIPPLLLQPLVENAIIHGLKNKSEGGKVTVIIKKENGQVIFRIIDNGKGIPKEVLRKIWDKDKQIKQGVGLLNIAKRLTHYESSSITIDSNDIGTIAEIHFPFLREPQSIS